uniref:Uncharacterized protein n=1 Tax=Anguilla anguilla TaxID=7936 RepID=A0A0E9STL8_ANGAN
MSGLLSFRITRFLNCNKHWNWNTDSFASVSPICV